MYIIAGDRIAKVAVLADDKQTMPRISKHYITRSALLHQTRHHCAPSGITLSIIASHFATLPIIERYYYTLRTTHMHIKRVL